MSNAILHKCKVTVEQIIMNFFSIIPFQNTILFESEGDFSDNSYAFYEYLRDNKYFEKKYRAIWLVDDTKNVKDGCVSVPKVTRYPMIRRLYYLSTSKYYFFDHCNILRGYRKREGQIIYNLFHGCTFKTTKGLVDKAKSPESFLTVTGDFWTKIMADFVQCDEKVVRTLGYPRNDYFFKDNTRTLKDWQSKNSWTEYDKVFLWMPTFRKSNSRDLSEDYYSGDTGLPILEKVVDLVDLNEKLKAQNALMVFKVHHLQSDYDAFKKSYSNINILKDEDIISCNAQLYQIVTLADILITDYSSISNDFLLLNRPMIFTLDDFEDYRNSRGFSVDDPSQYFPGYHVYNKKELLNAINELLDGKDLYLEDRMKMLPLMHKYTDGNSSKRIAEYVGL